VKKLLFSALLISACASAGNVFEPIPSLAIQNQSQFDLTELRIHTSPGFMSEKSVYPGVMKQNATLVFYGTGSFYVTAIRQQYEGGPSVAFTTDTPIELDLGYGYDLSVFDQSFRLKRNAKRLNPKLVTDPTTGDPGMPPSDEVTTSTRTQR